MINLVKKEKIINNNQNFFLNILLPVNIIKNIFYTYILNYYYFLIKYYIFII